MKLFLLVFLLSPAVFASKIRDDIRTLERDGDEVTMTLRSHAEVFRFPAGHTYPCLENGFKAQKPVDLVMNDKDKRVLECKLAPRMHPGAAGR